MTGYVTTTWDGSVDDHPRPRHPPYSPLWVHYHFPDTQLALLLFKAGQVIPAVSIQTLEAFQADDIILAGHPFIAEPDSWQVQVLIANGYPIVDYDGPVPWESFTTALEIEA